ncbi:hypothetical protein [Microbacterium aurantiacum]|uniref:hypothetical protein n=1 Tax=Microbacterium aurantiacum TaxID=162393 RepID=UPI003F4922FD
MDDARRRSRRRMPDRESEPATYSAYLRERIYASFTGLAIVLVVSGADHPEPEHAFLALLLGVVGITVAGFVSEVISTMLTEQTAPDRAEWHHMLRVAGGGFATVVTPAVLLALAWIGVLDLGFALDLAAFGYIATLAVIGWLAVRRSRLTVPARLGVFALLLGLGLLVIALQTLAKSV